MSTAKLNHNNADRSLHAENCKCPLRVKGCLEEKLKELISVAKKKKSVDCLTVGKKPHPCQDCNGRSDRTNGAAEIMRKRMSKGKR